MRHFKKTPWAAGIGTCLLGCLAMSSTASAEAISYDFTGTIHSATSQFSAGTYVIGSFGYNTAAASLPGGTSSQSSFNGLTSFSYSIFPAGASAGSTPLLTRSLTQVGGGPRITIVNNPSGSGPDQFIVAPPGAPDNPVLDLDDASGAVFASAGNLPLSLDPGDFTGSTLTLAPSLPSAVALSDPATFDLTSLTLVPEPGSLALFGGGLLGLALLRRRKAA